MAATSTAPILDLTTEHERQNIRVDGVPYRIKDPNDLTLSEFSTIEHLAPRVAELLATKTRSKAQDTALSSLLGTLCGIALVAPPEVCDRMGDLNRLYVFQAFTALLSPSLLRTRAGLMGGPLGGTKRSRGSSASTAGSRRRGSRRSPSASSGRA